jgi:hypothetical protein
MGKRGAGKTSLLKSWLSGGKSQSGVQEINALPTGVADTTACLIRVTKAGPDMADDPDQLHIDLFSPEDLADVDNAPPSPEHAIGSTQLRLFRKQAGDGLKPNDAFRVCRFPVIEQDDHQLRIHFDSQQNVAVLSKAQGTVILSDVQWHAKLVRMPVDTEVLAECHAKEVLSVLDVVDSPGADSMEAGDFGPFKRLKNSRVFQVATPEIDILMVVSSLDAAAINIGGQFQDDVWVPWMRRCGGKGEGRLILSLTRGGNLLAQAEKSLEAAAPGRAAQPQSGRGLVQRSSSDLAANSFASLILKNVLQPLAISRSEATNLVTSTQLSTWPLIFFFENECSALDRYRIEDGSAARVAESLIAAMENQQVGDSLWPDRPLVERCILRVVADWSAFSELLGTENIRLLKKWLIRALCAMVDPADHGLGLLTRTITSYARSGPVAWNHFEERENDRETAWRRFRDMIEELGRPSSNAGALAELKQLRTGLGEFWEIGPLPGLSFTLGRSCEARTNQMLENANPAVLQKRPFSFQDVVNDVVDDVVCCLPLEDDEAGAAFRRGLRVCLAGDGPTKELDRRYGHLFLSTPDGAAAATLLRTQAFVVERSARILDFIHGADDETLARTASICYGEDLHATELFEQLRESGLLNVSEHDETIWSNLQTAATALAAEMKAIPIETPYATQIEEAQAP